MDKNWLIRTKTNHILGPISKEKALELYQNGSLKQDDEVCMGNGFWFFIREDDMVNRYLLGNDQQSFNPISEAKDVLTGGSKVIRSEGTRDDITMVGNVNLGMLKDAPPATPKVEEKKSPEPPAAEQVPEIPAPAKKKLKSDKIAKQSVPPLPKRPPQELKKQPYLRYLIVLGFCLLLAVLYYRKAIIRHILGHAPVIRIIESASAQDEAAAKKKSS